MPFELSLLTTIWWGRLLLITVFLLLAWLVSKLAPRLVNRIMRLNRFARPRRKWREERLATLRGLIGSVIGFLAFSMAILFSLSLFVQTDTLVWMVGLFSAAFGLGARPLIADFLTGIGFMFEDTFDVGEKVELLGLGGKVEGVVEEVKLRTSQVRAPSGELITVPNGEIRLVRNFSRGLFSLADVRIKVNTAALNEVVPLLEALGEEAVTLLPNLLEPWQIISTDAEVGQQAVLLIHAKSRYGLAAEMRPRLLALIQERLDAAGLAITE